MRDDDVGWWCGTPPLRLVGNFTAESGTGSTSARACMDPRPFGTVRAKSNHKKANNTCAKGQWKSGQNVDKRWHKLVHQ